MKIRGVYEIVNKINNKRYIGSSGDIHDRWSTHKRLLRNNNHSNIHLQSSYNKYGLDAFCFNILEKVNKNNLLIIEQKYLNICESNPRNFYNISYCAESPTFGMVSPMKGRHHTKETIQKIKENIPDKHGKNHPMYGRKHTKKSIKKMCKSHKGFRQTKKAKRQIKETCIKKHINSSSKIFVFFHEKYGKKICRMIDLTYEFNLDGKHVSDICRKVRKSHKGWRCLENHFFPNPTPFGSAE